MLNKKFKILHLKSYIVYIFVTSLPFFMLISEKNKKEEKNRQKQKNLNGFCGTPSEVRTLDTLKFRWFFQTFHFFRQSLKMLYLSALIAYHSCQYLSISFHGIQMLHTNCVAWLPNTTYWNNQGWNRCSAEHYIYNLGDYIYGNHSTLRTYAKDIGTSQGVPIS